MAGIRIIAVELDPGTLYRVEKLETILGRHTVELMRRAGLRSVGGCRTIPLSGATHDQFGGPERMGAQDVAFLGNETGSAPAP